MNQYQQFIHKSRYARYLDEHKRRESWEETVGRYVSFMKGRFPNFPDHLEEEILQMNVMLSMKTCTSFSVVLELGSLWKDSTLVNFQR